MNKLIYILPAFFLYYSCDQNKSDGNPPYDISQVWKIHHKTEWDSLSTANYLVGKWKWNYSFCCGEGMQNETFTDNENYFIQIKDDATLEVSENGTSKQLSNWQLRIEDGDLFGIVADPPVNQIYGRILFTDEGVIFDDAYRDGSSNYFIKVE